jgi:[ribosomal protein S5]-alanine N-acetyltransferase
LIAVPMAYPDPVLSDGTVRLRKWSLDDLACGAEASTDRRIPEGTTVPAQYTDLAGRAYLERQWGRARTGEGISLAICTVDGDRAVGSIVLMNRPQAGVSGVGYWMVPSQRRHGYAARAAKLISDWAIGAGGYARVEAWVEPENVASQRVLMSAGFEHEGQLRSFLAFPTRRADAVVFSRVTAG